MVSEQWWQVQEVSARQVSTGVEGQNEQSKGRRSVRSATVLGVQIIWDTRLLADDFERGRPRFFQAYSGNRGSGCIVRVQEILTKTLPVETFEDICEDIWFNELQIVNIDTCCEGQEFKWLTGSALK